MVEFNLALVDAISLKDYSFSPHFYMLRDLIQAFIPLVLAFIIFTECKKKVDFLWWVLFFFFIIFLPNAPYTVGDITHFIGIYNKSYDKAYSAVVYIPIYILYSFFCMEAFVLSLMLFGGFLKKYRLSNYVIFMEIILILLAGFGILLGRFEGLYSWYIFTHPLLIFEAIKFSLSSIEVILIYMAILGILFVLYYSIKLLDLKLYACVLKILKKDKIL